MCKNALSRVRFHLSRQSTTSNVKTAYDITSAAASQPCTGLAPKKEPAVYTLANQNTSNVLGFLHFTTKSTTATFIQKKRQALFSTHPFNISK
jgi:hypothetical protein